MNPRAIRWWQGSISAVLCTLVVIYARAVPWHAIATSVASASAGWLALAAIAFLLGVGVRAVMWWMFLREVGAPSFVLALRGLVLVTALNAVVIANAGEAGRVVLISRRSNARGSDVVATIAAERIIVTCLHVFASLAVGLVMPLPASLARWRVWLIAALVLLGVMVAVVSRAHSGEGAVGHAVRTFRRIASPGRVASASALAAAWWGCNLASFHLTAVAMGLPISVSGSAIAFLMVSAGNAAHATPGNVGVLQMVYASTAHMLGLPTDQAIAVALVAQAIQALPTMVISVPVVWELVTVWRSGVRPAPGVIPLSYGA